VSGARRGEGKGGGATEQAEESMEGDAERRGRRESSGKEIGSDGGS
jgi:hypothetical protein